MTRTDTDVTLHELLDRMEHDRGDARPPGLTASATARICERQTALELHGVPPSDEVETVTSATVGTMMHEAYARLWQEADPDAIVERRGAHGTPDVVRPTAREVRDLKTKNGTYFDRWAVQGPPEEVWEQLMIYAGDVHADADWTLVIDVMCRDDGRTATYTRAHDPEAARDALLRLQETEARLLSVDPWTVEPTGAYGPAWVQQRCPWRSVCPAANDDPAAADLHVYDDAATTSAATDYVTGADMVREGEALKKQARVALRGVEGRVGAYTVTWVSRTMPPSQRDGYTMHFPTVKRAKDDE